MCVWCVWYVVCVCVVCVCICMQVNVGEVHNEILTIEIYRAVSTVTMAMTIDITVSITVCTPAL